MGYNFTAATKLLEYSVFKVTGNHIPLNKWQYLKNGERQTWLLVLQTTNMK